MTEYKLLVACYKGELVKVQKLLPQVRNAADIRDSWLWEDKTLLHYSCHHGWLDMTRKLVEQYHCNPECRGKDGDTPLHEACRKGHVDIVRYLVSEQWCSTISQNEDGNTLLHKACRKGHLPMVKALTSGQDCKAACNLQNNNGDTPLHLACYGDHVDIVRYLVSEKGCSTACQNKVGDTSLHVACRKGHLAICMVKALTNGQDYKVACNCQNRMGDTPLHMACRKGHVDIVRYLVIEQECSTACQNKDGNTLLHEACRWNQLTDVVKILVSEWGCSTACQNNDGDTPLHIACREGYFAIVEVLTSRQDCKAVCKCQNRNGDTPLHKACREGHVNIVRYLVSEQKCSTTLQNNDGNTPLCITCYFGYVDIVRYLVSEQGCSTTLQNMDGNTLLHKACREGHLPTVKALTSGQDCKAACNLQNNNGDTPLHLACYGRYVDIVRYLVIEKGCSTACQNKVGDTPLHVACRGHLAICMVKALTSGQDYKVACNCQNRMGDTPLHVVCRKGHVDIVRYLVIEQKCSTACQNKDGNTPLHEACRWNQLTDVVKILLSTGRVDPWCKNASNQTPVQLTNSYVISKLFAELAKDLKTAIKVFIFGNPAAGKSTLVKVIENKVTSRFGALAGQFRNVSGVELKTAGINAVTIQNSRLGTVTIYDLAGQFEYYASHDALVENLISSVAVFIAVVKLSESEAEVIQTLRYWISFIENCCSRVEGTAHLMVVGSWADKVKEAGENTDQKWLNIKKACISSSSPLHFVGFTSLDCRKLASSGLDQICDMIGSSCTALREAAEQESIIYPHLLHAFIQTNFSTEICCSIKELCTYITAEDDALLPTEPNLLSPLLSSLSDGGHLLYLPNKEDFEAGWVVINKQAVLSEINGTVFAPENFKQHHDIATSTGVVPKSKIAGVFAEMYNIDMILCVLTAFEFCQRIKDSFTLSLIASVDSSSDGATAMTTGDESSESYYFFPALVRVEQPTDVWQSSGTGQYQCGWCLQCSKEGQYLTARFLHMLLLRLAFSFALAPDSSWQDEASPVLRRRCAVWKNGIQWLNQDGVETIVEVSEQNKLALLLMSCPQGEEMACVRLRSSLISKILEAKGELCPRISTTELLIDPSNLSSYPLPNSSELTLYTMADQVVKAVRECKQFIIDITGRKKLKLVNALHFDPYHGMQTRLIDKLFDKDLANQEVDDDILNDLAANVHPKLMRQVPIEIVLRMFNISDGRLFYNYCDQFPDERDNPIMRCFRLLLTWKNCDTGGSTYQSLRTTLDKYSIFCGRNPMAVSAGNGEAVSTGVENTQ